MWRRQRGVLLLFAVVAAGCDADSVSSGPEVVPSVNPSNEANQITARISDQPRYHSMEEIADKLGRSGLPCTDRRTTRPDRIDCTLGSQSAVIVVFTSPSARDDSVRRLMEQPWLPAVFVVGANWLVNVDAYDQAQRISDVLGGIVVRHGPTN
jgi:hypothetical protein